MEHLTLERLACLVDEVPDAAEREHLALCTRCRSELDALVRQTRDFAHLPTDPSPESDLGWRELEGALRAEGLLSEVPDVAAAAPVSSWMRVAAAFLLFALGGAVGWGARGIGSDAGGVGAGGGVSVALESGAGGAETTAPSPAEVEREGIVPGMVEAAHDPAEGSAPSTSAVSSPESSARVPVEAEPASGTPTQPPVDPRLDLHRSNAAGDSGGPVDPGDPVSAPAGAAADLFLALGSGVPYAVASVEEAESVVRVAEAFYIDALTVYRELLEHSGFTLNDDPVGRFVALGNVIAITEEAVSLAPTDPFLNALLLNTLVEKNAIEQGIMTFAAGK